MKTNMKIKWTINNLDAPWSSKKGIDEEGNIYYESADGEIVTVKLTDGREGTGWTVEEALNLAKSK